MISDDCERCFPFGIYIYFLSHVASEFGLEFWVLDCTTQVFAPSEAGAPPGTYQNVVCFGPATIKLSALAEELQPDKLRVTFVDTSVELFGVELLKKPFPPGRAGTWRMVRL